MGNRADLVHEEDSVSTGLGVLASKEGIAVEPVIEVSDLGLQVISADAAQSRARSFLADEPTGNLDTKTSVEIMQVLQELNESGMTIVMVTHDHEIARYCQRTVFMSDGKVVRDEPVSNRPLAARRVEVC